MGKPKAPHDLYRAVVEWQAANHGGERDDVAPAPPFPLPDATYSEVRRWHLGYEAGGPYFPAVQR